jgi:putative transposase
VVWIPKYRRKTLYGELRRYLGQIFKDLARSRESEIIEGHMMPDHVNMLISIPPKYSVAQVIGFIKGKSAIHIARNGASKEFYWSAVLGQRLSRFNRWTRRGHCSRIHPLSGERG